MRQRTLASSLLLTALILGLTAQFTRFSPAAFGQAGSKSKKPSSKTAKKLTVNTGPLDVRAEQIHSDFVKQTEQLAGEYFEAGALDKAKDLLRAALAIDPNLPNVSEKLKIIEETLLTSNDFEFEVDPSAGWVPCGALVYEDRPLRFVVAGTYKFQLTATLGALGFDEKDPARDMIPGLPCGALIALIVDKDRKLGKPFLIGEGGDITPKQTGVLLLRINSPAEGGKHSGKLKVSISGNLQRG